MLTINKKKSLQNKDVHQEKKKERRKLFYFVKGFFFYSHPRCIMATPGKKAPTQSPEPENGLSVAYLVAYNVLQMIG